MRTAATPVVRSVRGAASLALVIALLGPVAAREPVRHSARRSQPATPAQSAPDTTGTTAKPALPQVDDETLPPLFNLPTASRARMRRCGERWQARKMAGQAGEEIWRDFATECLSQTD